MTEVNRDDVRFGTPDATELPKYNHWSSIRTAGLVKAQGPRLKAQ
jgi:hypothetical protein